MNTIAPSLLTPLTPCSELLSLVHSQVEEMRDLTDAQASDSAPETSQWSPIEHLEHLVYTGKTGVALLLQALEQADPAVEPMNELGRKLLARGSFPYKETQAPEFALPRNMSLKKLSSSLRRLASQLADLKDQAEAMDVATGRSAHPILGGFTPREWLQFIALHQNHHIEIIRLLIKAS